MNKKYCFLINLFLFVNLFSGFVFCGKSLNITEGVLYVVYKNLGSKKKVKSEDAAAFHEYAKKNYHEKELLQLIMVNYCDLNMLFGNNKVLGRKNSDIDVKNFEKWGKIISESFETFLKQQTELSIKEIVIKKEEEKEEEDSIVSSFSKSYKQKSFLSSFKYEPSFKDKRSNSDSTGLKQTKNSVSNKSFKELITKFEENKNNNSEKDDNLFISKEDEELNLGAAMINFCIENSPIAPKKQDKQETDDAWLDELN